MSREWLDFYEDMIKACHLINDFTAGHDKESFCQTQIAYHATIRNFEILGEAAKLIPIEIREAVTEIPWIKLIAFRNIIIHEYFEIDDNILWDVISNKVDEILKELKEMPNKYPQFFKNQD